MAWEEESIESGADFEEVGGKKNIIKMAIMLIVVLAIAAGGWFAYKKFMSAPPEEEQVKEKKKEEKPAEESEDVPGEEEVTVGFRVNLEKFTINLTGGGTPHYLVTTLVLEVSTEQMKLQLNDPEQIYMVKTRDTILSILREKKYEEIKDTASSKEVAKEIKFKLNRLFKDGKVINVYFTEYLID